MLNIIAGTLSSPVVIVPSSYESIATVTVGSGGSSSIDFTSIPATYTHLQIRLLARTTHPSGTDGDYLDMQFNSDTGANYATHQISANGSSASAAAFTSQTSMYPSRVGSTGLAANIFGCIIIDILDYSSTTKYKTVRQLGGYDANGSGLLRFASCLWTNTNAVTSINLQAGSGTGLEQYSTFALYGIKGV